MVAAEAHGGRKRPPWCVLGERGDGESHGNFAVTGGNNAAAIYNSGTLTLTNSTVAQSWIGIDSFLGTLSLNKSQVWARQLGVRNFYSTLSVANSTVSGIGGIGILDRGYPEAVVAITHSTVSGNPASLTNGGNRDCVGIVARNQGAASLMAVVKAISSPTATTSKAPTTPAASTSSRIRSTSLRKHSRSDHLRTTADRPRRKRCFPPASPSTRFRRRCARWTKTSVHRVPWRHLRLRYEQGRPIRRHRRSAGAGTATGQRWTDQTHALLRAASLSIRFALGIVPPRRRRADGPNHYAHRRDNRAADIPRLSDAERPAPTEGQHDADQLHCFPNLAGLLDGLHFGRLVGCSRSR